MTTNEASKQVARYYHVWRETNRIYSDWAKKHDISYNALLILYSLWNAKHYCTQKMICDQWMLPKQTVNTILKEFEKKSWYSSVPLLRPQKTRHPSHRCRHCIRTRRHSKAHGTGDTGDGKNGERPGGRPDREHGAVYRLLQRGHEP